MQVSELRNIVANLGFNTDLDADGQTVFESCVNRAIAEVYELRPKTKIKAISGYPLKNIAYPHYDIGTIVRKRNADVEFVADQTNCKSYSFEVSGNGFCNIDYRNSDNEWETIRSESFDTNDEFIRMSGYFHIGTDFPTDAVRLMFKGNVSYNIRNVAIYDEIIAPDFIDGVEANADKIPAYSDYYEYDFNTVADFLKFESKPYKVDESESIVGAWMNDNIVYVPYTESISFNIKYQVKPYRMTEDSADSDDIGIDDDLAELIPLLISVYLYMDDDAEKSGNYLALYRERKHEILSKPKKFNRVKIINTRNW